MVYETTAEGIILRIRLSPGTRTEAVGGIWQDQNGTDHLKASVRAVAEKGKANAALIALLAANLQVPKSAILLVSGDTSRLKRLVLPLSAAEGVDRLAAV